MLEIIICGFHIEDNMWVMSASEKERTNPKRANPAPWESYYKAKKIGDPSFFVFEVKDIERLEANSILKQAFETAGDAIRRAMDCVSFKIKQRYGNK